MIPRGSRRRAARSTRALAAVAVAAALVGCGDEGNDEDAACPVLRRPVLLPEDARVVLDRIVGAAPRLIDVVLRPWSLGDASTQSVVYVRPERAAEVDAVVESLAAAGVEVVDVVDQEAARRELELLGIEPASPDAVAPHIRVTAIGAPEAARVRDAVAGDERVLEVHDEAVDGPVWARFAPVAYGLAGDQLDEADAAAEDEELAGALRELREVAAELPPDADVPQRDVDVARRFADLAEELCDLVVEDA